MERLTKPTIGCFKYGLSNFEHKPKEFADYDAFYAYNMAVKRLGEYEDTGLTPEEIENLKDQSAADVEEVVHGKNITAMHPVDEFLCSVCGFCCSDYTQTRYDENGDYEYSCECEFSYCPNCGAKMDGGKES